MGFPIRPSNVRVYQFRHLGPRDLVPREGLEPTRPCGHMVLNHARLPIPPPRHARTRTEVRVRRSMIPRRPSGLRQEVEQAEGDEEDGEDDREAEERALDPPPAAVGGHLSAERAAETGA